MKIIPDSTNAVTANYWCSWCSQSRFLTEEQRENNSGSKNTRAKLTESFLFDPEQGLLSAYDFGGCRGDLIALLDDGWDVPPVDASAPPRYSDDFGSLILYADHFKSIAVPGDPAESLKRLNEKMKSLGYRGLGIWISPQMPRKNHDEWHPAEEARPYWEERAKWCHYAGVKYWKIDWGNHCNNAEYLRMMAESCRKYAPGLLIENSWVRPPIDPMPGEKDTDYWKEWIKYLKEILGFSDCFRTYDVIGEFEIVTTLGRIAFVFENMPDKPGIPVLGLLSVEHLSCIAAGIGAAQGFMFHEKNLQCPPLAKEGSCINVYTSSNAIDASARVLRWNRIAAPFSIFESENHVSEESFTSGLEFNQTKWPNLKGYKTQTAPAAMSRNCPLPEARSIRADGARPFVIASKYPEGPLAVATLPRTLDAEHINERIPSDVFVSGASADQPLGIFGVYHTLTVGFDRDLAGKRIFAQDLLEAEAHDCTDEVTIAGNKLILDGDWISRTGLAAKKHPNDSSDPGLVLILR